MLAIFIKWREKITEDKTKLHFSGANVKAGYILSFWLLKTLFIKRTFTFVERERERAVLS